MKILEKFAQKRFNRLHSLLKKFPGKEEKVSNHKIRLEIKRIKALLGLIHFHNKNFRNHKHYIPFRTIFRFAGKLRDAGLRQELFEQYTQSHKPFYRSPLKGTGKFQKSIPGLIKEVRMHEKIILTEISGIKRWEYYTYLQKLKEALVKKIIKGYDAEDLHKMRKQIKEIIYLTSIDKHLTTEPALTSMAEIIGNWHDKILLLEYMNNDSRTDPGTIKTLKSEATMDLKTLKKLAKEYLKKNFK